MDPGWTMEQKMQHRLEVTQEARSKLKDSLNIFDASIKQLLSAIMRIKRPKASEEELVKMQKTKTKIHDTTSQSNADERSFMWEMNNLKQQRKDAAKHAVLQHELDGLKAQRTQVQTELKEIGKVLDELYSGMRRLKMSNALNCGVNDIVEHKFSVDVEALPRVVGKGAFNIKRIETACGVMIDSDRSGTIRVYGQQNSIVEAEEAIMKIVHTLSDEFAITANLCVCLLLNKAETVQDIQSKFSVRIDVSRASLLCKITGNDVQVMAAKEHTLRIPCLRVAVPATRSSMNSIIGKGGSVIREIRAAHPKCDIDLPTPPTAAATTSTEDESLSIFVTGHKEEVNKVQMLLSTIVDDKTEISSTITSTRHILLGCFSGGSMLPTLQREWNVRLRFADEKKTELAISGMRVSVLLACQRVNVIIADYENARTAVRVPDGLIPIILGKKGSKISQMRADHPNVEFDVEDSTMFVHSDVETDRLEAVEAIQSIIDANNRKTVAVAADTMVAIRVTPKGQAMRTSWMSSSNLNLTVDLSYDENTISFRGYKSSIDAACEALDSFHLTSYTVRIPKSEDNCNVLQMSSVAKLFQEMFPSVEMFVSRKEHTVQLRGVQDEVEGCAVKISGYLNGTDNAMGSLLVNVHNSAFAPLIGKAGQNIKAFEKAHNVHVDTLRSLQCVRLRAADRDAVLLAQKALVLELEKLHYIDTVAMPVLMTLSGDTTTSNTTSDGEEGEEKDKAVKEEGAVGVNSSKAASAMLRALIDTLSRQFNVVADVIKTKLVLKGNPKNVDEAKTYLKEICVGGQATRVVRLLPSSSDTEVNKATIELLITDRDPKIKEFMSDDVFFELRLSDSDAVDKSFSSIITISGPTKPVIAAHEYVFGLLMAMFPVEYSLVSILDKKCFSFVTAFVKFHEICEMSGAFIDIDRPLLCLRIRGTGCSVAKALDMLEAIKSDFASRRASIAVQEHMVPSLLGKMGKHLKEVEKSSGASIYFHRDRMALDIEGSSAVVVQDAVRIFQDKIKEIEKEHWTCKVHEQHVGRLVGKGGTQIKQLRVDTGANIELNFNTQLLVVKGSAAAVDKARAAVSSLLDEYQLRDYSFDFKIPATSAAAVAILGPKGETISRIEKLCTVKLDLVKSRHVVVIKGSPDNCDKAVVAMKDILDTAGLLNAVPVVLPKVSASISSTEMINPSGVLTTNSTPICPGADAERIAMIRASRLDAGLSKSAMRRRRRKENTSMEKRPAAEEHEDSPFSCSSIVGEDSVRDEDYETDDASVDEQSSELSQHHAVEVTAAASEVSNRSMAEGLASLKHADASVSPNHTQTASSSGGQSLFQVEQQRKVAMQGINPFPFHQTQSMKAAHTAAGSGNGLLNSQTPLNSAHINNTHDTQYQALFTQPLFHNTGSNVPPPGYKESSHTGGSVLSNENRYISKSGLSVRL